MKRSTTTHRILEVQQDPSANFHILVFWGINLSLKLMFCSVQALQGSIKVVDAKVNHASDK
jgi:hypothetical protein